MNSIFQLVPILFTLLIFAQQAAAADWRGIVPLRSTRADVVRVFPECAKPEQYTYFLNTESERSLTRCEFMLPDEDVLIVFASTEVCPSVPPETVLMVQRKLRDGTTLKRLGLDQRRFKSFDPARRGYKGYRAYIDEQSGLLLKSYEKEIFQINYIPTKKERQVCPAYYRNPKQLVEIFPIHVVSVNLRCPEAGARPGEKVVITADYEDTGELIFVNWHTTGGQIVAGEKTRRIVLDTTGIAERSIMVTAERTDPRHTAAASCVIKVSSAPKN